MITPDKLPAFTILDGAVHVFKRDGSPFWWVGFHFRGKYIRTSSKQKDQGAAEAFAKTWYFQKQTEIASGQIASAKHSFDVLAVKALEHYKTLVERNIRSQKTYEGIEGILKSRVIPYFKKMPVTAIDNTTWHQYKQDMIEQYPKIKRGTLHQYKNAIRIVLNEAYRIGYIKALPIFKDEYKNNKNESSRPWFNSSEYRRLHRSIAAHANKLRKIDKRQYAHAMELYDYVIFSACTGMRVGELRNCKISDVKIEKVSGGKEVLIISNIVGKRGTGTCQSYYGAVAPFRRILERRNINKPDKCDEKLFLIHHRTMFNKILENKNLKFSNTNPPVKRDFVSLRATYICFRLLNGAPIYEIAKNCRTSVQVIEDAYAKNLGGSLLENINKTNESGKKLGWDY